jgi:hypothetical protein
MIGSRRGIEVVEPFSIVAVIQKSTTVCGSAFGDQNIGAGECCYLYRKEKEKKEVFHVYGALNQDCY